MRVAIFSDVHGNLSALEAVLADIERQNVDHLIAAGDLCFFGPRPAECIRRLRDGRALSILGNTDEWLAGRGAALERFAEIIQWNHGQLSADERDWLGRLPFSVRLSPSARAADDLLVVHANPRDVNEIIFPSEPDQMDRWGKIRQSDADLDPLLRGVEAAMIAYGHLHIPGIRHWGSLTLVNVSSVNMPGDEDGRAKYALLKWDGGRWSVTHHRVAYDVAAESAAFRAARPPRWEEAVAALDTQGYYYPQRI